MSNTPRPWRLDHSTVLDNDGNPVAIIADPAGDGGGERIEWPWVYDEAPPASYAQAEDNARLIASAPELLAIVQHLADAQRDGAQAVYFGALFGDDDVTTLGDAVTAAIAKAGQEEVDA